jgi:hypothetical protein
MRDDLRLSICDLRLGAVGLVLLVGGCASSGGAPAPATRPATQTAEASSWRGVSEILGHPGVEQGDVYTITIPRDDLEVRMEGMDVPTAAGLCTTFWFYRCPCGKTIVMGQFVVTDYEANDVAYALQKENILIASMSPLLLYDKPRLMLIRFQSEGRADLLAKALQSALQWTGKLRMAPQKTAE